MFGDKRSLEEIAATGFGWCTEAEFADLITQIKAARISLKSEGACVVCWTSSWEPVESQEECAIEHPHPEEGHIRCGHCSLFSAYKALVSDNQSLREFVEMFACECGEKEHDCAPEAQEASGILEGLKVEG